MRYVCSRWSTPESKWRCLKQDPFVQRKEAQWLLQLIPTKGRWTQPFKNLKMLKAQLETSRKQLHGTGWRALARARAELRWAPLIGRSQDLLQGCLQTRRPRRWTEGASVPRNKPGGPCPLQRWLVNCANEVCLMAVLGNHKSVNVDPVLICPLPTHETKGHLSWG